MGKAEDTKARVERAALTLFVARGVAETTTKEIAMAASIAEGTIYRYFPSKEGLALDLFAREIAVRSEEHTSELQSRQYLVCRLLLEKKNNGDDVASPRAVTANRLHAGDV